MRPYRLKPKICFYCLKKFHNCCQINCCQFICCCCQIKRNTVYGSQTQKMYVVISIIPVFHILDLLSDKLQEIGHPEGCHWLLQLTNP